MSEDLLPRSVRRPISGWGRQPTETCELYRPEDLDDARAIVAHAPCPDLTPRGLGRSYGDASLNDRGAVLLSDRLDRMIAFDRETGVLRCQAAVSLADIIRHFLPRGFFFPVTPGTKNITVGGAIAADVHGKNHHTNGSMSAWIERFSLLTGRGQVLECSREENADAFWATTGGMGLTGLILDAELRMKPVETAYMNADYERIQDLDRLLARMDESDEDFDYAVAWVDSLATGRSLGRSVLMRANHASLGDLPSRLRGDPLAVKEKARIAVPFTLPDFTLNPLSMRLFNTAFYLRHPTARKLTDCDAFFYPLDSIQHWNRGYGSRGVLQYQCVIPEASAATGIQRLLEELTRSGCGSFLTVLKSLGPASEGPLSFPMQGKTLALDLPYTGPPLLETLHRVDEIVLEHGGRVYLAKDSCMAREAFERMYPRLPEFKRVKARLDPDGRFSSSQARRLGIVEAD